MKEQVSYISKLIRVSLTNEEESLLAGQVEGIVEYINQLQEVDIEGVDPMYHPLPIHSKMRKDVVMPSLPIEKTLANAPKKKDRAFLVQKVI